MKYLKLFENSNDYEAYMAGNNEETVFPNISLIFGPSDIKFNRLLPNIDTTGYATTFVSGEIYKKEANLFKLIVSTFLEGYDLNDSDPVIWMDLMEGTVDIALYTSRQSFSIADQPLFKNYLSKITNFQDEEGNPSTVLNIFPSYVDSDEYFIGDGESSSRYQKLDFETGLFEITIE